MPEIRVEKFFWSTDDIISLTHGEQTPFPRQKPEGITSLKGTPIDRAQNVTMLLRDESGRLIGSGSELEVLPEGGKGILEVYFTIVIPDRGTLFSHSQKTYGQADPQWLAIFESTHRTGEPWSGALATRGTNGPGADGKGIVLAGTGEFAGMTGTMYQTSTLRSVTRDGWFSEVCETFELVA